MKRRDWVAIALLAPAELAWTANDPRAETHRRDR
jgi:uncharacterized membrane-anchored protein